MRTSTLLVLAAVSFALTGCGGKTGAAGQDGLDGQDGVDGQNGLDGQDGIDGQNGQDGIDGQDGQDGIDGQDGQDGIDGQDGQDGIDGQDGMDGMDAHQGEAPWGVNFALLSLDGATGPDGQFQIGDVPVVTFSVTDDDGTPYDLGELYGLNFQIAGPIEHFQIAVYYSDLSDTRTGAVYNGDGTYTYTFRTAIPATYHTVPNDTTTLGIDQGDWGGQPLVDGTYRIVGMAYTRITRDDGSYYYDAGNFWNDFLLGSATTLTTREVVTQDNCANCHGDEFRAHGGSRREIEVCQTCHIAGSEDRYSATDGTTTPGATVDWQSMVHKIHMGSELTNGVVLNGYPGDSTMAGYPNYNAHDYGDVVFPQWPMEAATCAACHAGAADGDVENHPSREGCGTCHDSVDWATGTNHTGGPQSSDSLCAVCHTSSAIEGYHQDPRTDSSVWLANHHGAGKTGLNITMLDVKNGSGGTTFNVGDTITARFSVLYDDGTPIPASFFAYSSASSTCPTVAGSGTMILTGPSDYMQRIAQSASASSSSVVGAVNGSSTVDSTTGIWTYTLTDSTGTALAIPATVPYQYNDNSTYVGLWGDLYGEALMSGTYRVAVTLYTAMWEDTSCPSGTTTSSRWRVAEPAYMDILVGTATTVESHSVVDDDSCGSCHNELRFHGGSRKGVDYCVMCHTAGAIDSTGHSVDFPTMIHDIHGSREILTNPYIVGSTTFDIGFPRQDGGVAVCSACHGENTAWQNPSGQKCMTCHNSDADFAHAALNTDPTYGESCDVCHGAGAEFSVESVHEFVE